jgi:hypothetical protein
MKTSAPTVAVTSGTCRYCGCTEERACILGIRTHPRLGRAFTTCAWWNKQKTVCTNPTCIAAALRNGFTLDGDLEEAARKVVDIVETMLPKKSGGAR